MFKKYFYVALLGIMLLTGCGESQEDASNRTEGQNIVTENILEENIISETVYCETVEIEGWSD